MKLSIDYDDTYTKDPILWDLFAQNAITRGHTVYCVSLRNTSNMEQPKQTIGKIIGVDNCFGTNGRAKREYMLTEHNISVDVWCDDMPDLIGDSLLLLPASSMLYRP